MLGMIGGFMFFAMLFVDFFPRNFNQDLAQLFSLGSDGQIQNNSALIIEDVSPLPAQEPVGKPVRLKIPKIKVDSIVEYVGLAPDGAMDVPQNPDDVAWFELGPRPGEKGSAVVAGHYGGKASAFDNLYKLRKGDKIYVEDEKGMTISFVVRENRRYDPSADTSYVFGSIDDKSHLNLVTCEGDWNKDSESYSQRLVVFTDRE